VQIEKLRQELGVSEKANLKNLLNNKYLQVRLQAKALKDCIQAKLRNRRFEMEQFNRVYNRISASGMFSLNLIY
jgi:SOS response regulatory protein OraA/RecX